MVHDQVIKLLINGLVNGPVICEGISSLLYDVEFALATTRLGLKIPAKQMYDKVATCTHVLECWS